LPTSDIYLRLKEENIGSFAGIKMNRRWLAAEINDCGGEVTSSLYVIIIGENIFVLNEY
jgi:hypothetical protein